MVRRNLSAVTCFLVFFACTTDHLSPDSPGRDRVRLLWVSRYHGPCMNLHGGRRPGNWRRDTGARCCGRGRVDAYDGMEPLVLDGSCCTVRSVVLVRRICSRVRSQWNYKYKIGRFRRPKMRKIQKMRIYTQNAKKSENRIRTGDFSRADCHAHTTRVTLDSQMHRHIHDAVLSAAVGLQK